MLAHIGNTCERVQAIRVPQARKRVQNARAHSVGQENAYKDARAHRENEWKGPPCRGGKEGGKGRRKEEEGKKKEKERKNKKNKQTIITKKKKQPILTKTNKA